MTPFSSTQTVWINAGARLFTLLALGAPLLWYREAEALLALMAIGVIWINATLQELGHWLMLVRVSPIVEAGLIGVVCGAGLNSSATVLLALAVPPFTAGVRLGVREMGLSLAAQLAMVTATALVTVQQLTADQGFAIFTWTMAGLGLGLIGSFINTTTTSTLDEISPYVYAQSLIRQLIDLSDGLSSGLDPNALGGEAISAVHDQLPTEAVAIYVPREEVLIPLVSKSMTTSPDHQQIEQIAVESWVRRDLLIDLPMFAFPLGDRAIVAGLISTTADVDESAVAERSQSLQATLRATAVQLDTAQLFADFRDSATADVRQRLAREMHDGVAQDIASLGYLVDALAARPATPEQGEQFELLRDRITKIIAEVRQSVLTLRTSIGEAQSLGTAIGTVARHLSEVSQVPIRVTLDEHSTRLRSDVEGELFRIAQEAMNNAIKHAQASQITVHCQVHAPDALITVSDDGRGLQRARSDSHGLKIMRERARLVSADLTLDDNPGGGLQVSVQISADSRDAPSPPSPTSNAFTARVSP